MEIDGKILVISFGLGIIGVIGLLFSAVKQWLMSPPKTRNNRFMGREYNNED